MMYTCQYCERDAESAHSITVYEEDGREKEFQVLCGSCYQEWLLSLKG
ncbi:hypothetical protein PM3016_6899 [Paenibacillus mucilaginosus 3016]|uniref:Uncharacterized protein n=2 Tax=Paenibacillus mucilaginosus TaxID=61624 RepID=H6NQM8_9BACL|nr:hypothetical protein PM3016_6899 [Paenibacillus mucilaginosus 3016]AFH65816.1 hypothetical protein B2K_34805 [Paenibacillus mucilaginosus K02]